MNIVAGLSPPVSTIIEGKLNNYVMENGQGGSNGGGKLVGQAQNRLS
jgi:hypothetical protein